MANNTPLINNDILLGSHPIEIYLACDKLFAGEPWLQWEPETLIMQLRDDVDDLAEDKLLAVQSVASNATVVLNMALSFEKAVLAFNNCVCVMDTWQPPYVEELCYAVPQILKILRAVHGPNHTFEFAGEVPNYVASVAKYRGWIALPRRLDFASELLNSMNSLTEKSKRYIESRELVDEVREVYRSLDNPTADAILNSEQYRQLSRPEQIQFAKIAGALLFDPTILYRAN